MTFSRRDWKKWILACGLLPASFLTAPLRAEDAKSAALSPEMQQSVQNLTSTDNAARQKAIADLKVLLGRQWSAIIGGADDETLPRLARLAQFQEGLSGWMLHLKSVPTAHADAMIKFGLDHVTIIAPLYCKDSTRRVEAIRELKGLQDPAVDFYLAEILDDEDRAVSVAAMEVAWDRPATQEVVDVLWERAVGRFMTGEDPKPTKADPVTFRSRVLINQPNYNGRSWDPDSDVCVQVLEHAHSPLVEDHLANSFRFLAADVKSDKHSYRHATILTNQGIKSLFDLARIYQPKSIMSPLMELVTAPPRNDIVNRPINGRQAMYASNRTAPICLWMNLVGEHPDLYRMRDRPTMYGQYGFDNKQDEDAAVQKIGDWWQQHKADYAAGAAPATAPAQ